MGYTVAKKNPIYAKHVIVPCDTAKCPFDFSQTMHNFVFKARVGDWAEVELDNTSKTWRLGRDSSRRTEQYWEVEVDRTVRTGRLGRDSGRQNGLDWEIRQR